MRLKYVNLPFLITLLAGIFPWITTFPAFKQLTWLPELIAVVGILAFSVHRNVIVSRFQMFIILLSCFQLFLKFEGGKSNGVSAVLSVIVMAIIFYNFFRIAPVDKLDKKIINQITIIYATHICFILFEVYLINTNNVGLLMALSNGLYKAGMLEFYTPVPQSIFKNSQAASQQCIMTISWFLILYFSRNKLNIRFSFRYYIVLIVAITVFIFYPTTTMQVVGLIMFFAIVYLKPFSASRFSRFIVLIVAFLYYEIVYNILTEKIDIDVRGEQAVIYQANFLDPIEVFFRQSLWDQLWGLGSIDSLMKSGIESMDLGIGIIVIQIGLVVSLIALISFLVLVIKMFSYSYRRYDDHTFFYNWLWIGSANALLAVGSLLSLGHYTVSLQIGGRTLLSFHIGLIIYSLKKMVMGNSNVIAAEGS